MTATAAPRKEYTQVIRSLTHSGLDAQLAEELVDIVAGFGAVGKRPKYFPRGQFGPDSIEVHTVFDPAALDVLGKVLSHPRIDSVEIFPRGIVAPDGFSARIRVR